MIRSLIRYIKGYVKIRVEGCSPERFINMCSRNAIYIWGLEPVKSGYEMYLELAGFRKIRPLARKSHTKVVLVCREGLPFSLFRWRKRKLFFMGVAACMLLLKIYSLFIWDIHFEGNVRWPDETLAEYLREQGVSPFMLKSEVDCPGIVKNIRREYNDIVWASASLDGSRLTVRVKENDDTYTDDGVTASGRERATDLIASSDGVITDLVTRSGVPLVHQGDQVKKGDILVLGRIEVTDDSGEITGYQYCRADADIYADTSIVYQNTVSLTRRERIYDGHEKHLVYMRIGDTRVSLGSISNDYSSCELAGREVRFRAGENIYLPLAFGITTARSCTFKEKAVSEEAARVRLSADFKSFCDDLQEKGIQIRGNNVKINLSAGAAEASGTVYLNESITEEKDTEIVMIERKETDEPVGTDD